MLPAILAQPGARQWSLSDEIIVPADDRHGMVGKSGIRGRLIEGSPNRVVESGGPADGGGNDAVSLKGVFDGVDILQLSAGGQPFDFARE